MKFVTFLLLISLFIGCKTTRLPSEKYSQTSFQSSYTFDQNQLQIALGNPLDCPLRVWVFNADKALQSRFNAINPIQLDSKSDTVIVFESINDFHNRLNFSYRLGSTKKKIDSIKLELPFPPNKAYQVIQGNNTNFTHNTDYSRFAIDFDMKINDTICAATNGYVVGLIDQYEFGGKEEEWRPFANYLTIYDPISGLFTQYVHLVKKGSLVEIGEKIESGQPIALSGNTGQTNMEHLHFNCLVPVQSQAGLESIPFEFVEGYISTAIKKGDVLKK